MTPIELKNKLDDLLKSYIKQKGFYSSGKLYRSINFEVDNNGIVNLNSLEYIQFLDGDKFLPSFFNTKEFNDLMTQFYIELIESKLNF